MGCMSLIRCGSLSVVSTVHVRDEMALHPQKKKDEMALFI